MITLTNNFHGTSANIRAAIGDELTASQIKRAKRELCGIHGCTCSGPAGARGKQSGLSLEQIDEGRVLVS